MRALALALLLAAAPAAAGSPYIVPPPLNTLTGNLRLTLASWVYELPQTADAAPRSLSLIGGNAWSQATAANQVGGSLRLFGGIGTRYVTVSNVGANAADDTWTPTINGAAGQALTAKNGGAGANQFNCQTNAATCALALKAAINAGSYGLTASCADAPCTSGVVYLDPTTPTVREFTMAIADAGGGAGPFGVATHGTDGQVLFNAGAYTAPGISFADDPDTGLMTWSANQLALVAGGAITMFVGSTVQLNGVPFNAQGQPVEDLSEELALGAAHEGVVATAAGDVSVAGKLEVQGSALLLPRITAASPAEPVVCGATTVGTVVYVNDNDDGAAAKICVCMGITNDATYDWVRLADETTACPFF